jgi:hypothetical protein
MNSTCVIFQKHSGRWTGTYSKISDIFTKTKIEVRLWIKDSIFLAHLNPL